MAKRPYPFLAVVRRTVVDTIRFTMKADNYNTARDKAEKFLEQFPDPSNVDGVDYAYIENREHNDHEVLDLEFDRDFDRK